MANVDNCSMLQNFIANNSKIEEPDGGFDAAIELITTYTPLRADQIKDLTAYTTLDGERRIMYTILNVRLSNKSMAESIFKLELEHKIDCVYIMSIPDGDRFLFRSLIVELLDLISREDRRNTSLITGKVHETEHSRELKAMMRDIIKIEESVIDE